MKRLILYGILLAGALLAPVQRLDVADLRPVQVIALYKEEKQVIIKTDTGDLGRGEDAPAALQNMRDTSPAVIYLDTAQYLLIGENTEEEVEKLRPVLKASVQLCAAEPVPMEEVGAFLHVHGKLPRLESWKAGDPLPVLGAQNNRLKFVENR